MYSVWIGPPQPKSISSQQLLGTLQPSELVVISGTREFRAVTPGFQRGPIVLAMVPVRRSENLSYLILQEVDLLS